LLKAGLKQYYRAGKQIVTTKSFINFKNANSLPSAIPGTLYETKMKITIEGHRINTLDDFYDQIEEFLEQGECPWGRNLDSLEEIVQTAFNYTDDATINVTGILWEEASNSKEKLGKAETVKWLKNKLQASSGVEHQKHFSQRIQQVIDGKEATLFDIVKDILGGNTNISLTLA
jgi:RNAse (barnase) inhibitor barstar